MGLISRKAAVEYLMTNMGWHDEDGYEVDDADEKRTIIEDLINGIPSVPAVPLDKLCEWLAENALCIMHKNITPLKTDAGHWKDVLTKWMEGLDDGK